LYPVPHLFTDPTGNSLGYKDHVIFPVRVTPQDKSKPVTLRLHVDYAVCEKLCVPAEGRAELTLAGGASAHAAAVTAAEARVPKPVAATALNLTARRADDVAKPLIVVDLAAPSGKPVALFVEGPTPEWALPIPKLAESAANGGRQQFSFELDGAPPGVDAKKAVDLTFTVVQGDSAYEVKSHLDERR
jgi:DsbC/DsbD-like thiol-disulfide interchange protein